MKRQAPWICADFTGIATSQHILETLVDFAEGFAQEALLHGASREDICHAFDHVRYELEHKRLCCKPLEQFQPDITPTTPKSPIESHDANGAGNGAAKRQLALAIGTPSIVGPVRLAR